MRRVFPLWYSNNPFFLPLSPPPSASRRRSTRPPSSSILVRSLSLPLSPCGSRWRREGGDARSLARCCGRRARSSPYNYGVMVLPWAEGRKEGTGERTTSMRESKGGGRGASTCCSTTTEAPTTTTTTTTTGFQIAPNRLKSEAPKVGHAQRTFPPSLPTRWGDWGFTARVPLSGRAKTGEESLIHLERCLCERSERASERGRD